MNCAERKDLLFLHAADALEPAERDEVRLHLATGCPVCAGVLAEAYALLAQATQALQPVDPSPRLKQQLMARIEAGTKPAPAGGVMKDAREGDDILERPSNASRRTDGAAASGRSTSSPWKLFATGLLSAAAAAALTSGVFWNVVRDDVRTMHSHDLQLVSLASETQPTAKGRVLWDKESGRWHVVVFDMKPPAAGRVYELWFIPPDGKPIPSETFEVDKSGNASLMVQVPKGIGPIAVAAITEEPHWVSAPTGAIHLAGKVP